MRTTFDRLLELQKELPKSPNGKDWDDRFFQELELFSYTINRKMIPGKYTLNFFADAVIQWYEDIYLKFYKHKEPDEKHYPQFKILYKKLKYGRTRLSDSNRFWLGLGLGVFGGAAGNVFITSTYRIADMHYGGGYPVIEFIISSAVLAIIVITCFTQMKKEKPL